jgi:hypothetical protein
MTTSDKMIGSIMGLSEAPVMLPRQKRPRKLPCGLAITVLLPSGATTVSDFNELRDALFFQPVNFAILSGG